jgi:hypothetical protein
MSASLVQWSEQAAAAYYRLRYKKYSGETTMLKIMVAATLSAICRDLWPVAPVLRWRLAPVRAVRSSPLR